MTTDRFCLPAVLAACAVVTLLSFAELARAAPALTSATIAAAPVMQLGRVVITAAREEVARLAVNITIQQAVITSVR